MILFMRDEKATCVAGWPRTSNSAGKCCEKWLSKPSLDKLAIQSPIKRKSPKKRVEYLQTASNLFVCCLKKIIKWTKSNTLIDLAKDLWVHY